MNDQELIDNVEYRLRRNDYLKGLRYFQKDYAAKVLVRYTRWIEKAKCGVELDALDERWSKSEDYSTREAALEIKGLQDEISHWKYEYYGIGGR